MSFVIFEYFKIIPVQARLVVNYYTTMYSKLINTCILQKHNKGTTIFKQNQFKHGGKFQPPNHLAPNK